MRCVLPPIAMGLQLRHPAGPVTTPLLAATGTAVLLFDGGRVREMQKAVACTPAGPFIVNQFRTTGAGHVNIVKCARQESTGCERLPHRRRGNAAAQLPCMTSTWCGYWRDHALVRRLADHCSHLRLAPRPDLHPDWGNLHAEAYTTAPGRRRTSPRPDRRGQVATLDIAEAASQRLSGIASTARHRNVHRARHPQHVDERFSIVVQAQHASSGFRVTWADVSGLRRPEEALSIAQAGRWSMAHRGGACRAPSWRAAQRRRYAPAGPAPFTYHQVNVGPWFGHCELHEDGDTRDTSFFCCLIFRCRARQGVVAAPPLTRALTTASGSTVAKGPNLLETLHKEEEPAAGAGNNGYVLSAGTDGSYNAEYRLGPTPSSPDAAAARDRTAAQRLTLSGGATTGEVRAVRTVTDSLPCGMSVVLDMTVYFENQPSVAPG